MGTIFTYGFGNHTLEDFLSILNFHNINLIIDVRQKPLSAKRPEFDKFALIETLRQHKKEYIHYKILGCTNEMQQLLNEELGQLKYFQCYERHLQKHQDFIVNLALQTRERNICLLCSEPDSEKCHRTLIADYLHIQNFQAPLVHLR